jgi:HD-GYP domain-containing protein (c-di-GMP phosphodiesterase class II)
VFTRLLTDLHEQAAAADHIRQTLDAVRSALSADAVCWHDELTGETLTPDAVQALAPTACAALAKRMIAARRKDTGRVVWRSAAGVPGTPCAATGVRVHRARPSWIVAISCDPQRPFSRAEGRLIGLAGNMLVKQRRQSRAYLQMKHSLFGMVRCLSALLDARDACTAGHSERVGRIAVRIGEQLTLPMDEIGNLHLAGLLHDIGKIAIRDDILLKPSRLTAEEYRLICEHPVIGDQIVATITPFARLRPGVRHHHERFDGDGYPDRLAGDKIPLPGRILAVADSYDAMMSARHYRSALSVSQIDEIFRRGAGSQWDREIVDAFIACQAQIYPSIYEQETDDAAYHALDNVLGEEQ